MTVSVAVDDRAVRRMLAKFEPREMRNRLRRGTRVGAAVYRKAIRSSAGSMPGIPKSFGKTRSKSGTRPDIYAGVRPASPLWNIFEGGADSHEIAPGQRTGGPSSKGRSRRLTGKLLMSGKAGDRWRGRDFVASMPVRHPGMRARPFTSPIFEAMTPVARRQVATSVFGDAGAALLGLEPDE